MLIQFPVNVDHELPWIEADNHTNGVKCEVKGRNERLVGIFIVIAGLVILLGQLGFFSFLGRNFWPLILIIPGIILHLLYFFRNTSAVILVPAGIMTVYGIFFLICSIWGWHLTASLWPVFIIGVALGLFEYALFEYPRPAVIYRTSIILLGVSIVLLFITMLTTGFVYVIAALLIFVGIWLIFGRPKPNRRRFR